MELQVQAPSSQLYDIDYHRWLAQTVTQLQARDVRNLDFEHLIEEIEELGRREKHGVATYLMRLCEHLLKLKHWQAERERCFRGWDLEVTHFRLQIQSLLEGSPSLKGFLQENFPKQYGNGRKLFLKASGLQPDLVPPEPVFTLEQALDEAWLPWRPE